MTSSPVWKKKILLIGYGNPGRLDDGLGPALAEEFERTQSSNLSVDANYQLSVEDAAVVAEHDIVIFADAAVTGEEPFSFQEIHPKTSISFSSHSIDPQSVLGLAHDMFKARTRGFALGIRGYTFNEFGQALSPKAKENLKAAIKFIQSFIRSTEDPEFVRG